MKKVMSIMVAMTLIINASTAQSGFAFGLKGGANYSNQYDSKNNDVSAEAKFGLAAGAFLAIPLGKYFGVQPEVLFSQKGFKATGKILGSPYDLTRTTNYIDVPLMLAIKPVEFITIVGGPHYSYLIKQKDVFSNNVFTTEQTQQFDNEDIRKNIFGFIGGVDINVKSVVIGLRAGWDVQNNNGDGTTTTPRYKNAWTQATLGFRLY